MRCASRFFESILSIFARLSTPGESMLTATERVHSVAHTIPQNHVMLRAFVIPYLWLSANLGSVPIFPLPLCAVMMSKNSTSPGRAMTSTGVMLSQMVFNSPPKSRLSS